VTTTLVHYRLQTCKVPLFVRNLPFDLSDTGGPDIDSVRRNEMFKIIQDMYLLTYLLTHSLTPWRRILFEKRTVTQLVNIYPASFMEPKGTLPCSQKPATGPYPETAEQFAPPNPVSLRSIFISRHVQERIRLEMIQNKEN
jgi:hypothetical protein